MLIKNSKANKTWSGIISLGIASLIGQLINLLSQPILTRVFTPDELGTYSFVISMATLIVPIASLKLETMIVVNNDNNEAEYITDVSIISVFIISILYMMIIVYMLLVGNNFISDIGHNTILVPFIVLLSGLRFVFTSHNNRYKKYNLMSKTGIYKDFSTSLSQVIFAVFGGGIGLQIFGYTISPIMGMRMQANDYIEKRKSRNKITFKKFQEVFENNFRHIIYMVPAQFINTFSYTIITLSVAFLYSTTEVGYYSVSFRVLGLPLVLITNNVSRVYIQKLSENFSQGKSVWNLFKYSVLSLSLISLLGFILLAIIAAPLSEFIFGKGYSIAGNYITILSFMFAIRFVTSSLIGTYTVFGKQNIEILSQSLLVFAGLGCLIIAYFLHIDIYTYLTLISISYGIIYMAIIVSFGYLCKKNEKL